MATPQPPIPISEEFLIREEIPGDDEAIGEVNRLAFGGPGEADLIDRLRREERFIVSLVAEIEDRVVGHILFSKLPIVTEDGELAGAALAPMAVTPEHQRQGIGSAMVTHGLTMCRARGVAAVVVLGHPDYYPRFGFSAQAAARLEAPFSGEAFMALELQDGVLEQGASEQGVLEQGGRVEYPRAFFEME